ncbi:MAG: hypothetical protein IPI64_07285 [Chloracidobacterium sp.]|nr:hypothetical protein [Chloracidobacterium sp.]
MKNSIGILLLALLLPVSNAAQEKRFEFKDLAGMAGCWTSAKNTKETTQSEVWTKPSGGTLFGIGQTVFRSKTTGYEFMRIEQRDDGIYFVSRPKENPADTSFKLISSDGGWFVFENKAHDFPQRVIYSFTATKMTGRIEGTMDGRSAGIDFPMVRTKCP